MNKDKSGELDALKDASSASERVMIERVFDKAVAFYKNPENIQAFEAWKKNKEELLYGTNYIDP